MKEQIFKGISASPGITLGKVFIYKDEKLDIVKISKKSCEEEISRLISGRYKTKKELEEIRKISLEKFGEDKAAIFDGHITLLEDEDLFSEINEKINNKNYTAEYALNESIEEYINMLLNLEDNYFKERASDLKDIGKRWLYGIKNEKIVDLSNLEKETIIFANDLTPSDTAQINLENVNGFVTEMGGKTSHSSIMARSFELPAIVGVGKILENLENNQKVILDAESGIIILNPSVGTVKKYIEKQKEYKLRKEELKNLISKEAISKDGKKIDILGNIGSPKDVEGIVKNGAFGIGLYRTEFLFMDKESFPNEDEQFEAYKEVLSKMEDKTVTIRTMDIGGDKYLPYMNLPKEENPFLGWRAIRICLDKTEILKTQFKALLRASKYGKIKIMLPMISDVGEIKKAKDILNEVKKELKEKNIEFDENIPLGIMVETPAVVMRAKYFAKECDFFSIGTNDLTQYTLAVDRGNKNIANLYDPFNPAVLCAIKNVIDGGHEAGIKVSMCGEFAGEETAIPLLLAMGIDSLSMSAVSILKIKKIISNLNYEECKEFLKKILEYNSSLEIKEKIKEFMENKK